MTPPAPRIEDAEWTAIYEGLPDIRGAHEIGNLPHANLILGIFDPVPFERLKLSRVCFQDASRNIIQAKYTLAQAIGCKQQLDREALEHQDDKLFGIWADLLSQGYANYVPLLLYSSGEHLLKGLGFLLAATPVNRTKKHKWLLPRYLEAIRQEHPGHVIIPAIEQFNSSGARQKVWQYRDDWVHQKPPIIESSLFDPPRKTGITTIGGTTMFPVGERWAPDWTWEHFLELLKGALQATSEYAVACANAWEEEHNKHVVGQEEDSSTDAKPTMPP